LVEDLRISFVDRLKGNFPASFIREIFMAEIYEVLRICSERTD